MGGPLVHQARLGGWAKLVGLCFSRIPHEWPDVLKSGLSNLLPRIRDGQVLGHPGFSGGSCSGGRGHLGGGLGALEPIRALHWCTLGFRAEQAANG